MALTDDPVYKKRRGAHFLIPAGAFIGLGIGLIAGYPGSGVLIGLGLGFLASAILHRNNGVPPDSVVPCCGYGKRWISALVGVFMIIIGIGIIWGPANFWPYIIGIFLVVLGLTFIAKFWSRAD
jgi:hypothetical protein